MADGLANNLLFTPPGVSKVVGGCRGISYCKDWVGGLRGKKRKKKLLTLNDVTCNMNAYYEDKMKL